MACDRTFRFAVSPLNSEGLVAVRNWYCGGPSRFRVRRRARALGDRGGEWEREWERERERATEAVPWSKKSLERGNKEADTFARDADLKRHGDVGSHTTAL
jgi:hypothetical protein